MNSIFLPSNNGLSMEEGVVFVTKLYQFSLDF